MEQDEEKRTPGRRLHNRDTIEKFLVFFDSIFPSSAGSFFNIEAFQGKPESTPPIPDHAFDFINNLENRDTAQYLNVVLGEMRAEQPPLFLIAGLVAGFIKPLQDEEIDHAALRRWRAGETEKDKNRGKLFRRAINWLEERLNDKHPHLWIHINIDPRDTSAESKQSAAYEERRWETEDSLRRLHRDWCILHYLNDYSSMAAREEVAKWHDVSPKKVERAITHCNKELKQQRSLLCGYYQDADDLKKQNKKREVEDVA